MTELSTSETLNLAADLIEERGWTKGIDGWKDAGPLCLEGALIAATGQTWRAVNLSELHRCPAYLAVADYLGRDVSPLPRAVGFLEKGMPTEPLWMWNDDQKKARKVIETLRAAALVEAAREDAALLAEVGTA